MLFVWSMAVINYTAVYNVITDVTSISNIAEGPLDALVSTNPATTKHRIL